MFSKVSEYLNKLTFIASINITEIAEDYSERYSTTFFNEEA
jgi:hypothetical protein